MGDVEKGEAGFGLSVNPFKQDGRKDLDTRAPSTSTASDGTPPITPTSQRPSESTNASSERPLIRDRVAASFSTYWSLVGRLKSRLKAFVASKALKEVETVVRSISNQPDGYPKLATFLDSDENFMVYRRFGYVQSRLILEQQDNLRRLEYDLEALDYRETEEDDDKGALKSRDDFGEERKSLLKKLKEEWLDYSNLLLTASNMTKMNKPTSSEYTSVNNCMWCQTPVHDAEGKFTQYKEDLVSLRPGREHAWLDASIEHLLRWFHCGLIEWIFRSKETQKKTDGSDNAVFYTRSRIDRFVMLIVLSMILILLIVPIYILYHLSKNNGNPQESVMCIGVLLVFTLAFSACVSLFTRASRHEILAATAAYCAVLVVFIGNIGGGSGNTKGA